MKIYFAAVFLAILSIPMGLFGGQFFMARALHPTIPEAVAAGCVVGGVFLFLGVVLFIVSMFRGFDLKPKH